MMSRKPAAGTPPGPTQGGVDPPISFRAARDEDSPALSQMIGAIWAEYPNCWLDVENEETDLLAIRTAFENKGGAFLVAESNGRIVGSVGYQLLPNALELKKLYVARDFRRYGVAARLAAWVAEQAVRLGFDKVEAWSDLRFVEAHEFYLAQGYVRTGRSRELHDISQSTEIEFVLSRLAAVKTRSPQ